MLLNSPLPLIAVLALFAFAYPAFAARQRTPRHLGATALALAHPLITLGLFVSLAIHMHTSLGAWPKSIGYGGFPPELILHAEWAMGAFTVMILAALVALPIAMLLCHWVPKLRPAARYVSLYGFACFAAFGATFFAPDGFLYWWWD